MEPIFCFNVTPSTGVQNAIDQGLLYKFYAYLSGRSKKTAMRIEESFPLCASLCSVSLCETFFHVSQMVLYGVNTG